MTASFDRRPQTADRRRFPQQAEWLLLTAILLIAAFMRLYRLDAIPPGWTHDEAAHGHDAAAIAQGARPIYQTVGYGREPLYDYAAAALMTFTRSAGWALRLTSVACGMLTLWLTFLWARSAFDGPTAWIAVALQAASFWSLAVSRQALRSTLLLALFAAAVTIYWQATLAKQNSSQGVWALLSLLIGATLYTYLSARVMWLLFPAFLIYLALWHRATFRRVWFATLLALALGWLMAAPMFLWLQQHPGAEQRLAMLDAPLQTLRNGDAAVILERAASGFAAFLVPGRGDDFLAYTIPGRPLLDMPTALLFALGLLLCLVHWRKPAYAFAVLWFGVGIAPTLITGAPAAITRSITALPVTFLFPALAAVAIARWAAARWGALGTRIMRAGIAAWIVAAGAFAARDYLAWAESPDVRAAYQHTLAEIAHYVDTQLEHNTIAISTVYPQAPHDPYVFELSLRRRDTPTRWFDARAALLIPAEATARLIVPASTPLDAYFADLPGLRPRDRVTLRPGDLDPFFVVYDWEPAVTLAALRTRATIQSANLGHVIQFIGYDWRTPQVKPGGTVEVVTLWQVTDPQSVRETGLVFFTHALDAQNKIAGQQDRLDAPTWSWRAGDVIAQVHRVAVPPNAAGSLALEIGAYTPADLARLPVLVNNVSVGNRVLLRPVEIQ